MFKKKGERDRKYERNCALFDWCPKNWLAQRRLSGSVQFADEIPQKKLESTAEKLNQTPFAATIGTSADFMGTSAWGKMMNETRGSG